MRKWIILSSMMITGFLVYLFGIQGYTSYYNGWLYNHKESCEYKTQVLMLIDISDNIAARLDWTKEQRDSFFSCNVDSLDRKYYRRKGIYIGL